MSHGIHLLLPGAPGIAAAALSLVAHQKAVRLIGRGRFGAILC